MNKQNFLSALEKRLSGLPKEDKRKSIEFYSEMIDDYMDNGLREEEAVANLGSIDEVVERILAETPLSSVEREQPPTKTGWGAWEITLVVLGAPIWLSILLSLFSVVLSLFASIWSVCVSMFAVFVSLVVGGIAGAIAGVLFAFTGHFLSGMAVIGASLVCLALSILIFPVLKNLIKGSGFLSKKIYLLIKKCFVKKEGVV